MNSVVAPVNARALSRVDHAVDPQTADSARCIVDLKPPPGADALSGLPRKRAIDKASSQGGRDRAESSTATPAGDSCGAQHTPARSVSSRATAQRRPRYSSGAGTEAGSQACTIQSRTRRRTARRSERRDRRVQASSSSCTSADTWHSSTSEGVRAHLDCERARLRRTRSGRSTPAVLVKKLRQACADVRPL